MSTSDEFARIAVVGTSCAGKTTFASSLAQLLAVPHLELDAVYWGPNWTPVPLEQFRDTVDRMTAQPRWVSDGNYHPVRDLIWQRASAIVWLNYSFPLVFSRALRRTLSRCIRRTHLFGGNRESFVTSFLSRDSILLWILKTHWQRQREYPSLFAEPQHRHLRIAEIRNPSAADRLLTQLSDEIISLNALSPAS
jgi:adenylate kinase family enzyme